jgi:hypothetical protein
METIKIKTRIGADGILKLETPKPLKSVETEVLIVLQAIAPMIADYDDFFARIDAIEADDLVERPAQLPLEVRDEIV